MLHPLQSLQTAKSKAASQFQTVTRPAIQLKPQADSLKFAGAAITPEEKALLDNLPKANEPANLVMIGDPGFDVDDETAFLVASALHKRGLVNLKAVVATTIPSADRALLSKGVFNELDLGQVPVAVGKNHTPDKFNPEPQRLQASFLPDASQVETDAQALLWKTLEDAPAKSLTLLLIANQADAAELLKNNETLFQQKVKQVVIMGGVTQVSEEEDLDASGIKINGQGLMEANTVATNNRHDQASANFLCEKVQELGIPLKIVTRKAATSTPVSPDFFKDLADTGNSVANHIRGIEGDFLNKFWQGAYNNQMGPGRDKAWFIKAFCKPDTPDTLTTEDDIRPYLKSRVLYDAIALLACVDTLSEQLFTPVTVKTREVAHQIIGLSGKVTGLVNPEKLATLLSALGKDATLKPASLNMSLGGPRLSRNNIATLNQAKGYVENELKRVMGYKPLFISEHLSHVGVYREDERQKVKDALKQIPGILVLPEDPAKPNETPFVFENFKSESGKNLLWTLGLMEAHNLHQS